MNRTVFHSLTMLAATLALGLAGTAQAGDPTGANYGEDIVQALDTASHEVLFAAGETAAVYVSGDGDTDLDLYVYDANGNLVCSDEDETDEMLCVWTPRRTQAYRVEITNLGDVYNAYAIETN